MASSPSPSPIPGPSGARAAPLTQVAEVRALNQEQASRALPIRIDGIVTDLPGYKNSFFLQDASGGISVDRTDSAAVRVGDRVEVTGKTNPGLFAPTIVASHVRVLRHGLLPAPISVAYHDIAGGALDSQWVELHGVVRSARMSRLFKDDVLILVMELNGGSMTVILQDFAGIDIAHLVDAAVRLRGVCASNFNDKRQFIGAQMFIPNRSGMKVLDAAADDPFTAPSIRIRDAMQYGQNMHRVKVSGIATYQAPGRILYLQDGRDGIAVRNSLKTVIPPGTKVEAVGFPSVGSYAPILEDGVVRIVGDGKPPLPLRIDAEKVIVSYKSIFATVVNTDIAPYDGQLVQLQGQVVENLVQGGQRIWVLRHDSEIFQAYLPLGASDDRMSNIATGSSISVTGICEVRADSERNPVSFSILMRTSQDIAVLKRAPWWTPGRTLLLLGSLASATLLVSLWVLILRKRVELQTQTIRESEERFRYLAEHDELTGLLNRRAIMLVLVREIARGTREKTPVTLVLGDLDHFKLVNDVHGHLGGDAALRRFASALSNNMRSYDRVGRYGGEEFLFVLCGVPATVIEKRLIDLHHSISNLIVRDRQTEFPITCSLGAVQIACGANEIDVEAALATADKALYQAKESGRNRVVLYSENALPAPHPLPELLPPGASIDNLPPRSIQNDEISKTVFSGSTSS